MSVSFYVVGITIRSIKGHFKPYAEYHMGMPDKEFIVDKLTDHISQSIQPDLREEELECLSDINWAIVESIKFGSIAVAISDRLHAEVSFVPVYPIQKQFSGCC